MKMRKLFSVLTAAAIAAAFAVPQTSVFAATTFSTPEEFITDVVEIALTDISSTSMNTAMSGMQSKITVSGDEVLYDGTSIGYWYSDESTTLYADAGRTLPVIEKSVGGYTVDPTLLATILTDVNNGLEETYTPATSDWSKIVGRYDITLGNTTIPAEQWISMTPSTSDDPITTGDVINLSALSGVNGNGDSTTGNKYKENALYVFSWLVDDTGELYLRSSLTEVHNTGTTWGAADTDISGTTVKSGNFMKTTNTSSSVDPDVAYIIKVGLSSEQVNSTDTGLKLHLYATNADNSLVGTPLYSRGPMNDSLFLISNSSTINTCEITNAKAYGVAYFKGSQSSITNDSSFKTERLAFLDSQSCSKTVVGNAVLSKRIIKLGSIGEDDILTVSATGWTINGTTNIDSFLASQQIISAGDAADIDAVAEVEPLCFKVIIPTTLPIYIAADGTVSTANNATVTNKSNAAVKITDIDIAAKAESGWTLVANNPSMERDANEFTFTTSLTANTSLDVDEVLPFTYDAALSPMTDGVESLDLATVTVTVDWAE